MGDIVVDDFVDLEDVNEFAKYWLQTDCEQSIFIDLNGDCIIDFTDWSILIENWLQ